MKLRIITSNYGKFIEFQKLFKSYGIGVEHCNIHYDEVQTYNLEEVVYKGMNEIIKRGVEDFIIDDSGLFVDALRGFPGVWSAYVQRTIGNRGLLKLMENIGNRRAEFRCCIGCYIRNECIVVTGSCIGEISLSEVGENGFGFDPIFTIDGKRSFSQIPVDDKNMISHRGNAVRSLVDKINNMRVD